jgi:NAD(P)-dependent dehydrogenase (short-subunit alcohol dehydrogenase family)
LQVIVVGNYSLIGAALARALRARGDRVTSITRRPGLARRDNLVLDLADPGEPEADLYFFCAAMTSFAECRARSELAERVNATAADGLTGKTLSASFDPWTEPEFLTNLCDITASDVYTMGRINPDQLSDGPLRTGLQRAIARKIGKG